MKLFTLTLYLAALTLAVNAATLNEAQVFEWWDDGIIDGDEAREILDLLEEGNEQEACMLAEVYALENCANESDAAPKGYIEWKGRTDSLGNLESQRTEIRLNFYRYSLRLGSQSLLTYKNEGSEAHFGQISTKELHSAIPLDTLWGTAALYPLGMFRAGALLDTAMTSRLNIGIVPNRQTTLQFAYWHHHHPPDSTERHSFSAQLNGSRGNLSTWWIPENGGDFPLTKLQLHHREKMEYATVSWKVDAYAHGDSPPEEAHLSSTIAKSRFWGSQTIGIAANDPWKSKLTVNARTMIPLESDTNKTRFKASIESGPVVLRNAASATCLSAEEHCRQNDFAYNIHSAWNSKSELLVFSGKFRTRHTRGSGFDAPLYEAGVTYATDAFSKAAIAITISKGTPQQELQLRSSAEVGIEYLRFSMVVTFRRTTEEALHPIRAAIKAKVLF